MKDRARGPTENTGEEPGARDQNQGRSGIPSERKSEGGHQHRREDRAGLVFSGEGQTRGDAGTDRVDPELTFGRASQETQALAKIERDQREKGGGGVDHKIRSAADERRAQ